MCTVLYKHLYEYNIYIYIFFLYKHLYESRRVELDWLKCYNHLFFDNHACDVIVCCSISSHSITVAVLNIGAVRLQCIVNLLATIVYSSGSCGLCRCCHYEVSVEICNCEFSMPLTAASEFRLTVA